MHERLRGGARSLLTALLGAAFLLGLGQRFAWTQPAAESTSRAADSIHLMAARPVARIPIPSAVWKEKRTTLAISIVRISNPQEAAFSITVSLEPRSGGGSAAKANLVAEAGALGVYPTGQTGDYRLDTSAALARVRASGADASRLCLRLELRGVHPRKFHPGKLHPEAAQSGLTVTLSPPQWLPAQ